MIYTLCCQVTESRGGGGFGGFGRFGRFLAGGGFYGNDTLSVCRACNIKIGEMVAFLSSDREHMKLGLFPDVQQSYLLHSAISFDEVSCKALLGTPLKENEFLKIEQTPLADVIAVEAGNEHLRSHEAHAMSPGPEKEKEGPLLGGGLPEESEPPRESLVSAGEGPGGEEVVGEEVSALFEPVVQCTLYLRPSCNLVILPSHFARTFLIPVDVIMCIHERLNEVIV